MPITVVRAPSDGLDTTSAPFAPNTATRGQALTNMLAGRPGKLVPRGAVAFTLAQANLGVGAAFGDSVLVQLSSGNYQVVSLTGTTPALSGASFAKPAGANNVGNNSPSQAIVGDYCYIRANTGGIVRWDGTNTVAGFLNLTNGPQVPIAVAAHLSRVFAVGGNPPGGGTVDNRTLYWTDPGGPGADLLAGWQDDVSGLVNKIKLNFPAGDFPFAMVSFQRQLLIFGKRNIIAITGSTPSAFQQQIVASVGCYNSAGSLCVTTDGVYFMSEDGLCLWDGVELKRLYSNVYTGVNGSLTGWTIAEMTDQYLLISNPAGGQKMYHIPSGSWSVFTGPKNYKGLVKTTNYRAGWTDVGIDGLDHIADPELSLAAGNSPGIDYNGAFSCNALSSPVRLAEPLYQANVRRFAPRFLLYDSNGASAARLHVEIRNTSGVILASADYAPNSALGAYTRSDAPTEMFAESSLDLAVYWQLNFNSALLPAVPEVHDCYVEWDQAQK